MYHRAQQFQASIKGLVDVTMVALAFALAYVLRFVIEIKTVTLGVAPLNETVSLGVAATGVSGEGAEDLYKAADLANYRARHNGGNRVELSERGAFVVSGMSAELSWSD